MHSPSFKDSPVTPSRLVGLTDVPGLVAISPETVLRLLIEGNLSSNWLPPNETPLHYLLELLNTGEGLNGRLFFVLQHNLRNIDLPTFKQQMSKKREHVELQLAFYHITADKDI